MQGNLTHMQNVPQMSMDNNDSERLNWLLLLLLSETSRLWLTEDDGL